MIGRRSTSYRGMNVRILWKPPRSAADSVTTNSSMPFSDCLSFNQSRDYSLPNLASRRRRRRRIIIMGTVANIASLSAMTPTKNRTWPEQYEVTPIHVRRTCTAYRYDVGPVRRVHVRQCKHSSYMYAVHV